MYFTNGDHRAFESLMRDKPGDHYDSGADGPFPECRSSVLQVRRVSLRPRPDDRHRQGQSAGERR